MQEIGYLLYFLIFYGVLMIIVPAKVLRLPLRGRGAVDSIVKSLLVSYTVLISLVYALALLHIYNRVTLWIGVILTLIVYGWIKKVNYRDIILKVIDFFALLGGGQYKLEIIIKDKLIKFFAECKKSIISFIKSITFSRVVYFVIIAVAFVILMQRRLSPFLDTYAYMTSDMYVHHEWINFMEAGDIFYDGIYPYGMHNMLSGLHFLTGLHMNRIFRFYGALNCVLTLFSAIYFLRKVCRTKAAVLIYMMLYGVTDFAGNFYAYRMVYTLPQECGMPFVLVAVLFLGKFLEEKKKEDGVYFALAASLVLSHHFFTVIFAVAICGSLGLTYLRKIWKEKMILPLFKCLILLVCISTIPFMVGKIQGKYWQGSMTWALGVISNSMETEEEESSESASEEETTLALQLEERNEEVEETEAVEEAEVIAEEKENILVTFFNMMVEKMSTFWGYVLWFGVAYTALFLVIGLKKWQDWRTKQMFAVFLTILFCILLIGYWIVGLPQLMKEERVRMFVGYFGPMLLCFVPESFAVYFGKKGKAVAEVLGVGAAAACFYVTYGLGIIPYQSYFYLQTSTAAEACVKISEEFEENTWTIVSPVEELSLVRGQGYHYELWEFITKQERYQPDRYLEIPTEYVFFIIEKKPITYNAYRIWGDTYYDKPIMYSDADRVMTPELLGISDTGLMKYYNDEENRTGLEAKLRSWVEAYRKLFPDQISLYMETPECAVYCLKQNPYSWNNLAIDYGTNVISDEEYSALILQKRRADSQRAKEEQ